MAIKCVDCSRCCENIFLPFLADGDEKRWIEYHGLKVIENEMGAFIKINNKCSQLKDGKCSIYEDRPDVCRKYDCGDNKEFLI
jgi:Fe-S-cluster containining protein